MEKVIQQVGFAVATFTRPADTTAYATGDTVADVTANPPSLLKFPDGVGDGRGGNIRSAVLISSAANPGTKLSADLFLFDRALATNWGGDNAAFSPADADIVNLIGVISLDGTVAGNVKVTPNSYVVVNQGLAMPFSKRLLGTAALREDPMLYGVLVARNAYTPESGEIFTIKLGIEKA